MTLHFYLQFSTRFGQTLFVSGNIDALGNDDIEKAVPLAYLNDQLWHGSITVPDNEHALRYKYLLRQQDGDEGEVSEGSLDLLCRCNRRCHIAAATGERRTEA